MEEAIQTNSADSTKKIVYAVVVLVLIVGLIWYGLSYFSKQGETVTAYQFTGQLVSVTGDTLIIKGGYISDGDFTTVSVQPEGDDVQVVVTPSTSFVKHVLVLPERTNPDGSFSPSDITSQAVASSFDELKNYPTGTLVNVRANGNIYSKKRFEAAVIGLIQPPLPADFDE